MILFDFTVSPVTLINKDNINLQTPLLVSHLSYDINSVFHDHTIRICIVYLKRKIKC